MSTDIPKIIQGGMGMAVSGWKLARAVSMLGQLGVVSGVAPEILLVHNLGIGDPEGHYRRALGHFPNRLIAENIIRLFYRPKGSTGRIRGVPMYSLEPPLILQHLLVCGTFVQVWLAKENNPDGKVGINFLTKIDMPILHQLLGAMLAEVDVVLMGAGIPRYIPDAIKALSEGRVAKYPIVIIGQKEPHWISLKPTDLLGERCPVLNKPKFLAITATNALAKTLVGKMRLNVDGFVVEGEVAGGHNAPPRGNPVSFDPLNQPVYGPRDQCNHEEMKMLGLPFWLAGGYGRPGGLAEALRLGAQGIQVGTLFAFCDESGMVETNKATARKLGYQGKLFSLADPLCSPTGYPFRNLNIPGTLFDETVRLGRNRVCGIGVLRTPYLRSDGTIGYRCPSEPTTIFVSKGGTIGETVGRVCLCAGLGANAGLGKAGEPAIVTGGKCVSDKEAFRHLMLDENSSYGAENVMQYLLDTQQGT